MFSREVMNSLSLVSCGSVAPTVHQSFLYTTHLNELTTIFALMGMIYNQPHLGHDEP